MPRKKRLNIKLNDSGSLENLMQEVYNDACSQINDSQRVVNEVSNTLIPETVDDVAKLAKEKTNALKLKSDAIKIKLESGKLLNDVLKASGDAREGANKYTGNEKTTEDDFQRVREMIKQNAITKSDL